jgi:hypothetical protein
MNNVAFSKFKQFYDDNNSITCFDIDNTLTKTSAVIRGIEKSSGNVIEFTEKEYNALRDREKFTFDFSDFGDLHILKSGKLITKNVNILKSLVKEGKFVSIVTAREDKNLIIQYMRFLGVSIDPKFIFVVNDKNSGFTGSDSDRKKQAFEVLIKMGFKNFTFYDDDKNNLDTVSKLKNELGVQINPILV